MLETNLPQVLLDETFDAAQSTDQSIRLLAIAERPQTGGGRFGLRLTFSVGSHLIAEANLTFVSDHVRASVIRRGGGFKLMVVNDPGSKSEATRWGIWLRRTEEGCIEMVEVGSCPRGHWDWTFPGHTLHTNRGGDHISLPMDGAKFRFGPYSQYGQIFDFKDWFAVQQSSHAAGLMLLRPGRWRDPARTLGLAIGDESGATLRFSVGPQRVRRSYMLVHPSVETASARTPTGLRRCRGNDFVYPSWPAKQIARHGFARPERLAIQDALTRSVKYSRPARFLYERVTSLEAAMDRCSQNPALAKHQPLWRGEYDKALEHVLAVLEDSRDLLVEGGVLHPFGNPVLLRPVTPAIITFHMLDLLGKVTDERRTHVAELVATITELTCRLDFYDWRLAHSPTGEPGWAEPLFRGMHNQNFNTDRYVAIGLAGCVFAEHPHAAAWRRHAVGQFALQMDSFVWPGGAWEESHSYSNVVRTLLLCMAPPLLDSAERVDLLAHPKFQSLCGFMYQVLGPPDALIGGFRGWPAIGDHGYVSDPKAAPDWSFLFGWFATFFPEQREKWLWTWSQSGYSPFDWHHEVATLMAPLLLPTIPANPPNPAPPPDGVMHLPGYGAVARLGSGTPDESVLVIRGGESWGHYHHDQGSFWWWSRGQLICADSALGGGPIKFQHSGHNVMGYVDRNPSQYLDRVPFKVVRADATESDAADVVIDIPTHSWNVGHATDVAIPVNERPHHVRRIQWLNPDAIQITDASERSPDGLLVWSLHVVAKECIRTGAMEFTWDLGSGRRLVLTLPSEPLDVTFERHSPTLGIRLKYPEATLSHQIHIR